MSHSRLLLLLMSGAAALGSIAGACFGLVQLLAKVMDGVEEPL